jgi:putative ABC transport system substrate-binding protein
MRRREFITLLGGAAIIWPVFPRAQQKATRVVGFLSSGVASKDSLEAFQSGLAQAGYTEGQNIIVEYRYAEGKFERLPAFASELLAMKVEAIIAAGAPAARVARQATTSIPIVMLAVADPVALGLVGNINRPDGNLTGLTLSASDAMGRRLGLLKEMLPKLAKVRGLWNPNNPAAAQRVTELQDAARTQAIEFSPVEARESTGLPVAFQGAVAGTTEALLVVDDPLFTTNRKLIVDLAAEHRMPAIYGFREFAEAGGLIAFGASLSDLYRRSAGFVDRILKGAKPADLPIEQPTKFELLINLKTAKALGITIPPTLHERADKVIE